MTGFDETVPSEDDTDRDEHAAGHPEHDSKTPALADESDPDEAVPIEDDEFRSGQYGSGQAG